MFPAAPAGVLKTRRLGPDTLTQMFAVRRISSHVRNRFEHPSAWNGTSPDRDPKMLEM